MKLIFNVGLNLMLIFLKVLLYGKKSLNIFLKYSPLNNKSNININNFHYLTLNSILSSFAL